MLLVTVWAHAAPARAQALADSLLAGASREILAEMLASEAESLGTVTDAVVRDMIAAGDRRFHEGSCIRCHGRGGTEGPYAPDLTDREWLHSQGEFEGIFRTIFWGVPRERVKALTPRPFEMHPRGGMVIDRREIRELAAYVWSLGRGPAGERGGPASPESRTEETGR